MYFLNAFPRLHAFLYMPLLDVCRLLAFPIHVLYSRFKINMEHLLSIFVTMSLHSYYYIIIISI